MKNRIQANANEADPDLGAAVLLNGLLFAQIWSHLNTGDKKQLRAEGRGVRAQTLWSWHCAGPVRPNDPVISAAPLSKPKALVLRW
jgi:hypothetical protein